MDMTLRGTKLRPQGFTLIEIVMVLAIAGLILVVVFLAVSGAQKARRDTQRKRTVAMTVAALDKYFGEHGQTLPTTPIAQADFSDHYMPSGADPLTGLTYSISNANLHFRNTNASHNFVPPVGDVYVMLAHWCNKYGNGNNPTDPVAGDDVSTTKFVVWMGTEQGSYYCLDNY